MRHKPLAVEATHPWAVLAVVLLVVSAVAVATPRRADAAVDEITVEFATFAQTVHEAAGTASVTVTAAAPGQGALGASFTVDVLVAASSTATDPDDFTVDVTTLSFDAADVSPATREVTVALVDDGLVEGPEVVSLLLDAPTAGDLGDAAGHDLTIEDADGFAVSFATTESTITQAGTVDVAVVLDTDGSPTEGPITARVTAAGLDLVEGADQAPPLPDTEVTFPAGSEDGAMETITVPIGSAAEGDDAAPTTLDLALAVTAPGPDGAVAGTQAAHQVALIDEQVTIRFRIVASSVAEDTPGGTHTVAAEVVVQGGGPVPDDVSARVSVVGGTATPGGGNDFTLDTTTVAWGEGAPDGAARAVTLTINDDRVVEGDETIVLRLSNPEGDAVIGQRATHTVTVTDDDEATIQFRTGTSQTTEADREKVHEVTAEILIAGGGITEVPIEAEVAVVGGDATAGTDFTLDTTMLSWRAGVANGTGRVVTLTIVGDDRAEGDEDIVLRLRNLTGPAVVGRSTHTVTIDDNDFAPVAEPDAYQVDEGGTLDERTGTGVRANDTDGDDPRRDLVVTLDSGPDHAAEFVLNEDGSFVYTHNGEETGNDSFEYLLTDPGGNTSNIATARITVRSINDVPVVDAGRNQRVDENTSVSLDPATFVDGEFGQTHTATIDWGDGSPLDTGTVTQANGRSGEVSGSHVYTDDTGGPFTVTVCVRDDAPVSPEEGCDSLTVTVDNVAPTVNIIGEPKSSPEGTAIQLLGGVSDPSPDDTFSRFWTVSKDGVPGYASGAGFRFEFTPDDEGVYEVTLEIADDDGGLGSQSVTIAVTNVAPEVVIRNAATRRPIIGVADIGEEGAAITLVADASDPGAADTLSYEWAITQPGVGVVTSGQRRTITFTSPDDGFFFVNLTVRDDDGASVSPSPPVVSVANADPIIDRVVTDPMPAVGTAVNVSVVFSDEGRRDTHDVTVRWGDGTTDTISPAESPASGAHVFVSSGVYSAEVCAIDDDGGIGCATWRYNVGGSRTRGADFNRDGEDDLAIGVPGEDESAGGVAVIFGAPGGPTAAGNLFLQQGRGGLVGLREVGDGFGAVVSHGDYNDDGYMDLAVGAPMETMAGVTGTGNVTVIYGAASGLAITGSEVWHQDRPGVPDRNEAGDHFGAALTSGDFNGDGFWDLAVGAPDEDVAGVVNAGRVIVLYGSPAGLTEVGADTLDQDTPGAANKNAIGDRYGAALASGDFNDDGFWDLAAGVPGQDVGVTPGAGAVAVIYGAVLGIDIAGDQFWHQGTTGIEGAPNAGDRFGSVLAAGDLTGDGPAELIVGVPGENVGPRRDAGVVHVMRGSGSGLTAARDVVFGEGRGGLLGRPARDDQFGAALAVGDVDGDGNEDLLIGIPRQRVSGRVQAGTVAFIPGSRGLGTAGNSRWHEDRRGIRGVAERADHLGAAVALVDVDGNGRRDAVIGIPDQNGSGRKDVGAVLVISGGAAGLRKAGSSRWTQDTSGIADTAQKADRFGAAL